MKFLGDCFILTKRVKKRKEIGRIFPPFLNTFYCGIDHENELLQKEIIKFIKNELVFEKKFKRKLGQHEFKKFSEFYNLTFLK